MRRPRLPRTISAIVGVSLVVVSAAGAIAQQTPQAPPPTPVDGRPSPFPTDLQTPTNAVRPPSVSAPSAILADLERGTILYRKAPDAERPIASLTKVMTALIVLDEASLDDVVRVDPRAVYGRDDYGGSSTMGLRAGERITIEDLLYGLLLGSANDAADALAFHVDGSVETFVDHMNRRAVALGMRDTTFASPSGLDDRGRSTVSDLLRLVRAADRRPAVGRIVASRFHRIDATPDAPARRIQNRNVLLWLYPGADGMKTGFTFGARACLIATATRDGQQLVAVVLGAPDDAFTDAAALLNHGFEGYAERTLVTRGEPLGSVRIRGGTVPVVAADDLTVLVPTAIGALERTIEVDPEASFPPPAGSEVGVLQVRTPSGVVGQVAVVVDRVPPAPAEEGSWWIRTASTVAGALAEVLGALSD